MAMGRGWRLRGWTPVDESCELRLGVVLAVGLQLSGLRVDVQACSSQAQGDVRQVLMMHGCLKL